MNRNKTILLMLAMLFRTFLPFLDMYILYWALEEAATEPKDFHKLDIIFILGAFIYSFISTSIIGLFPFIFILSLIIGNLFRALVPKSQMNTQIVISVQIAIVTFLEKGISSILTINEIVIDKLTLTRAIFTIFAFLVLTYITQKNRKLI